MLSGDIQTNSDFLTHSRESRQRRRVVSLERTSTVLFHRLVPMMAHSEELRLRLRLTSSEVRWNARIYFWLTGRSVESMGSPCLRRRSMDLCVSQRPG